MDRAIDLPIAGDVHAKFADSVSVRPPVMTLGGRVCFHKRFNNRGDVPLIDGTRVMQARNDGSKRKLGGVIHPESPFALTIARRAS